MSKQQSISKKPLVYTAIATLTILVASSILDAALQLGSFHGLVFGLYSMYGLGFVLLACIIAAILSKHKKSWLLAATIPTATATVFFLVTLVR